MISNRIIEIMSYFEYLVLFVKSDLEMADYFKEKNPVPSNIKSSDNAFDILIKASNIAKELKELKKLIDLNN